MNFRVDFLEKEYAQIDEKLQKLLTNHLPHVQNEITQLRGEIVGLSKQFDERIKGLSDRVAVGVGINVVLMIGGVVGVICLLR